MTESSETLKKNVLGRLRKIEGQVRGIHGMVENGAECEDILNQVKAAQSALRSATGLILRVSMTKCFERVERGEKGNEDLQKRMDKLATILARFV